MTRGRIVVVALAEPYPFGQANGRWLHALLTGLAERRYEVRCLSLTTNAAWRKGAQDILDGTGVQLSFYPAESAPRRSALSRKWRTLRRPYSGNLSDELRHDLDEEITKGYDVLHLEQLWSGYLAPGRARTLTSVHHLELIDLRGVWHPTVDFLLSKAMMGWAERRVLARLRSVRTTTARLEAAVRRLQPRATIHTVPIALDPAHLPFEAEDRTPAPTLGFIATMSWNPGALAAERLIGKVFPRVRARCPEARLIVAGWKARRILARHVGLPGVEIIEDLPEARTFFEMVQVFAYPLPLGSGMMAKILEAMAYGLPIVTTNEGIEGVAAEDGVHAFITDDDEVFAERVVQLLEDAELRRRMRRRARALLEERYSVRPVVAALERVYETLS